MRRREMAGCGHPLPFAAAAGLALGLALFAHQLFLTLAAVVIGPLPAVQTALYLSRKDLSEAAAQAVSESAQETQAEPAQETPALPAGDMEAYLVPLEGDEARPEGAGAILEKNYPQGSGEKYIPCGSGSIKNNTNVSNTDVAAEITNPLPFAVEWNSPDPQILIMHTHASEAFTPAGRDLYPASDTCRTEDTNYNIVHVGDVLADTLTAAGLQVLHDRTIYDYPSYTGSYNRSGAAVQEYLNQYPSLRIVIDLHRDALCSDSVVYKTVAELPDAACSQVMLLVGTNASGLYHPYWEENLRLAVYLQDAVNAAHPTLMRPITLVNERYNQHLTRGSLIIEVGSSGNTLQEATRAVRLFGESAGPALARLVQ